MSTNEGQKVIVDTGSPKSLGKIEKQEFPGSEHLRRISEFVGTPIDGLVGMDWLGDTFMIDLRSIEIGTLFRDTSRKNTESKTPKALFEIDGKKTWCFIDTGAPYSYVIREMAPSRSPDFAQRDFSHDGDDFSWFDFQGWNLEVRHDWTAKKLEVGTLPRDREQKLILNKEAGVQGVIGLKFIQGTVMTIDSSMLMSTREDNGMRRIFHKVRPEYVTQMKVLPTANQPAALTDLTQEFLSADDCALLGNSKELKILAGHLRDIIRGHMLLLVWHNKLPVRLKLQYSTLISFERLYNLISLRLKVRPEDLTSLPYNGFQFEFDEESTAESQGKHLLELAYKVIDLTLQPAGSGSGSDNLGSEITDEIRSKLRTIEIAYSDAR